MHSSFRITSLLLLVASSCAFTPTFKNIHTPINHVVVRMSSEEEPVAPVVESTLPPAELSPMDAELARQEEKQRRADELRAQEVFIQRSTGKHRCTNCNYEYDEAKGDVDTIGGMIQPDTAFVDLPANWRCPTCRAQKGAFEEIVTEIPGFEVNQGYGFGGNSMTGEQKTGLIFGGLGLFFILFLGGYGMS